MNCGSCCTVDVSETRRFFTKGERIQMLQEYKQTLDKESQGVSERIKELESEE